MAKRSAIERNRKRDRMAKKFAAQRARLKKTADDRSLPMEERFQARLKLAKLPRTPQSSRSEPLRGNGSSTWCLP